MALVKATPDSEAGQLPGTQELEEMGRYNEELVKAGILLDGDGLRPSTYGARVAFDGDGRAAVHDGPFTETKELIAGYWIIEVASREEAIEWIKRAPFRNGEIEIRPFATAEDFGEAFTPELQEKEDKFRAALETR